MSSGNEYEGVEGVAIIGMAGRFPGARDLAEFWSNLRDGRESISAFTRAELEALGVEAVVLDSPHYVMARGILEGVEMFDAPFFGLSGREAELMDPHHRIFLEQAWAALEDAGYDTEKYEGAVGVYGGMSMGEYLYRNLLPRRDLIAAAGTLQLRILNDKDFLTPLAAYKLNLRGPSVNVQTACSTSLVAVHLACQSLLSYQCDMALAGGVSITVPQKAGYFAQEGVFAPDGHCRAFDERAQGTVSGNGVGVVVLKRLSDALADGDDVRAVIRGSAINNDGSAKVGYTAPSVEGQAEVVAMAQALAGVSPETITYVEAHGTGTPLGDSIEIAALTQAFRVGAEKNGFCAVGSVKTNMGHADAAAGVASLIKTTLALRHRQLPPNVNFETPSTQIDWEGTPFYVSDRLREWRGEGGPRRAGVSSFAMGGVNAHLVLEEAPAPEAGGPSREWQLLTLSAKTDSALESATDLLAARLRDAPAPPLADVAHTLQSGRRAFSHRRVLVCRDAGEAAEALGARDPRRLLTGGGPHAQGDRPVAFMFPGLGNHYVDMGVGLYRGEPVFREHFDRCCELLRPALGLDLREVILPGRASAAAAQPAAAGGGLDLRRMLGREGADADAATARLNRTLYTQPALFVVEYALARLWESWGVRPQALVGYSIGEYVAACLAGVLSLEDALPLVAERARLIEERVEGGSMLAVPLSEEETRTLLGEEPSLAAVNGPEVCVVAGPRAAVGELARALAQRGVACRELQTSHAFHSRMMEPIVGPLTRLFEKVKLNAPRIPVVSNVTGTWLTPAQATDPTYWARHLSQTVRFGDAVRELLKAPGRLLLEVGPGQALGAWALQHPASDAAPDLVVASSLRHSYDQQPDTAFILNSLGRLWLAGAAVDWKGFTAGERRRRVPLPTYPFERRRYWVDPPKQGQPTAAEAAAAAPERSGDLADWFYLPLWKQTKTPAPFNADAGGPRNWLVFSDGGSLSARLLELLAESGQNVSTVTAGERFEAKGGNSYVVEPASVEDYEALFKSLRAGQQAPHHVVHLWGTEASEAFELSQERGVHSLFALAKALGNAGRSEELRLLVVTRGVLAVTGSEDLRPERATALGPCKVIPQEYPHVRCLAADVDAPPAGSARERELADLLLAEATAPASTDAPHELVVAYRGSRRWAQTFAPQRLERPDANRMLLREGGAYLITGGLGGVGLTLAEHLARTHGARLVLTGRTPLPPREDWERLLDARGADGAVSGKLRKLLELEAAGADVLALSADVSDLEQMRAVVAAARARFGRIDGVIHAAGVQPGGLMQVKEREALERVLAPKVRGVLVLAELLADDEPDFLLLCSSLNAIYGTLGLADHCAANSFLDAFAHASAARGSGRVVSVNWDAWLEVGQAANAVVSQGLRQILGEERPDDGARLHPLLDRVEEGAAGVEVYTTRLSTARHWVLDEHRLRGQGLVPGTAYLEMVRAAYARRAPGRPVVLRKVVFSAPLLVADGEEREARTTLTPAAGAEFEFSIESRAAGAEGAWREHARGRVGTTEEGEELGRQLDIAEIRARCAGREVDVAEERARLRAGGGSRPDERDQLLRFGPRWENLLRRLSAGTDEGLAFIELPEEFDGDLADFGMHPSLLDVATGFAQLRGEGIYLPLGYERLTFKSPLARRIYSHVRYRGQAAAPDEVISCDIVVMDEDGKPLVEIEEFVLRRVHAPAAPDAPAAHGAQAANNGNGAGPRPPSRPTQTVPAPARAQPEGIAPREGAEVLTRLLTKDLGAAQVAVSARDLDALIRQVGSLNRSRILEELERLQTIRPRHPRPNVPTPYAAPRNEVEQGLAEVWQEMLGVEEVGVNDNFFDLGGDSLLASQLISRLEKSFQVDMSLRNLFAAPTVAELAVLVLQKQSEQVDTAALAEVLAEIKGLTPAELQALLDADAQPTDVKGSHE